MRYETKLKIVSLPEEYPRLKEVLKKFGIELPWREIIEVSFEKSDPLCGQLESELRRIGLEPFKDYGPAFETWEVEQAELLHLFISGLCGVSFAEWSRQLGLPLGTRVIDKREMKRQDIAHTYAFEVVISGRLMQLLADENLSGWSAQPIQHRDPSNDRFPTLYHLSATNKLPSLTRETELLEVKHTEPMQFSPGSPLHSPDPLYGTTGLFQRGPLQYRRRDLKRIEDFNRTYELFGEEPQKQPYLVVSQRAWQALRKHKIRNVDVEPVVILEF